MSKLSPELVKYISLGKTSSVRVMIAMRYPDELSEPGKFIDEEYDANGFLDFIRTVNESKHADLIEKIKSKSNFRPIELLINSNLISDTICVNLEVERIEWLRNEAFVSYVTLVNQLDLNYQAGAFHFPGISKVSSRYAISNLFNPVAYINAPDVWDLGFQGEGITCAIVDTGVHFTHPQILNAFSWGSLRQMHKNLVEPNRLPKDLIGHGTAVAGIIAATGKENFPVGVAPKVNLLNVSVNLASSESIIDGLTYCVCNPDVDVICSSLTWKYRDDPNHNAFRNTCMSALHAGKLHANSSGNDGISYCKEGSNFHVPHNILPPGNCPPPFLHPMQIAISDGEISSAVSVGSVEVIEVYDRYLDVLASNSGRGPCTWDHPDFGDYLVINSDNCSQIRGGLIKPDLCAPGTNVPTLNYAYVEGKSDPKDEFKLFSGTSASTPMVAGAMCLLAQAIKNSKGKYNPALVNYFLEKGCSQIGIQAEKESGKGSGRLDILKTFEVAKEAGVLDF